MAQRKTSTGLKVLVIGMGVLLLGGMIAVGIAIASRIGQMRAGEEGFGEVRLQVPEVCSLAEARHDGGRLLLRFEGARERDCERVEVLDAATGQPIGRILIGLELP